MSSSDLERRWTEAFPGINLDDRLMMTDPSAPREWIDAGFSPEEFQDWSIAGGFSPNRTKVIKEAGLLPDQVAFHLLPEEQEKFELESSGETFLFMFCNEQLPLETLQQLVKSRLLVREQALSRLKNKET